MKFLQQIFPYFFISPEPKTDNVLGFDIDKEFEVTGLCGCPNTPNYRHNHYDNTTGTLEELKKNIELKIDGRERVSLYADSIDDQLQKIKDHPSHHGRVYFLIKTDHGSRMETIYVYVK